MSQASGTGPSACPLCDVVRAVGAAGAETGMNRGGASGTGHMGDARIVCQLEHSVVVLSENQGCPGWCVLVLKEHAEHLAELSLVRQEGVFREAARVAQAIREEFSSGGGRPPRVNYECLGNQVAHVHWHVIPRHADDPEPTRPVWGRDAAALRGTMSDGARTELASRLRARLGAHDTTNRARVFRFSDMGFDTPMALLERRRIMGERVMLSHVTLLEGFVLDTHAHENEQLSVIVSGRMKFGLGRKGAADYREVEVGPGEALLLPAWTPHSAAAIEQTQVLDVFSPVSAGTGIDAHRR